MANTTSPEQPTTQFDFTGLRRLATCETALKPLADTVATYMRVRDAGGIPPETILVSATLKAAQVMARSSLFKSNCAQLLEQALPQARAEDDPENMPTVTRITAVRYVAWQNMCAAAALRPSLLHHKSVCDTLRNAFGTGHRRPLGPNALKCYGVMLQHLDGVSAKQIVPSLFTRRLSDQLGDWAYKTGLQKPIYTGQPFPQNYQPEKLADRAYTISLRLVHSPAAPE